jgi:GH35 family endo-1,4-beta-xylanase
VPFAFGERTAGEQTYLRRKSERETKSERHAERACSLTNREAIDQTTQSKEFNMICRTLLKSLTLGALFTVAGLTILPQSAPAAAPDAYRKAWSDVSKRIDEGIERNRKGDVAIEVVGENGQPVKDATLQIQQKSHAFLFGCNAFVLGQMGDKNQKYEEAFTRLFNFATVPFYWAGTEPVEGELRYAEGSRDIWRRPSPERFLAFAKKHDVTLKGHPLLWHAHNPPWLPKDPEQLKRLYQKRFREIAERFGKELTIWDVVNESLVCPKNYQLYSPGKEYVRWAFQEAVPLFPTENVMMINEVTEFNYPSMSQRYFDQIRALVADGAQVRGIGFQYHYFRRAALDKFLAGPNCNPGKMLDVYEQFAGFNLPLYVTEITIPSAGEDGEELQAEVVRDHYRLWFSAPKMAGITWWNLGDGTAVKGENEAQGGLMDGALEPKASYRALDKLINHDWKTNLSATTDAAGKAQFRGFYGKYTVKVTTRGVTKEFEVNLTKAGESHKLTLGNSK